MPIICQTLAAPYCGVFSTRVCVMLFLFVSEGNLFSALCHSWDTLSASKSSLNQTRKCQRLRVILSFVGLAWFSVCFQSPTSKKGGLYSLPPHPFLPIPPHLLPSGFCSLPLDQNWLCEVTGEFLAAYTRYTFQRCHTLLLCILCHHRSFCFFFFFLSCWDITLSVGSSTSLATPSQGSL